ncbi:MAG: DUF1080 domain-containing protein [Planctomycetaceae bacterium]|jgi:hypothetical protein|nr:DUF1080 domain-containing protein [Planctomycetaceae bacterium]
MKHLLTLSFLFIFAVSQTFAEDGFRSLVPEFKDKVGGDAAFTIDGDTIVGKCGAGANTFLCTEKKYSNFILKFDVKLDEPGNSGVQFRSAVGEKDGQKYLYGYQCEILEPSDTANVYDERNRDRYLVPQETVKNKITDAYKKGDWNSIEIQCVGPSIKTRLNGEKIVDIIDIEANEGIFGLQVHSGKTGQIRWKNIRIKELPATPWVPLYADKRFNEDIEIKPVGEWKIQEDGVLNGKTPEKEPRDGIVVTKSVYKNFAVKVSFKMEHGNSGLYFRASNVDKPYWLKGFQCEIAEGNQVNANLWEVQGRGWVQKTEATQAASAKATKEKEWNTIGTVAVGEHIVTFLNGWTIVNIIDGTPSHGFEGFVGLQLHGGGNQGCLFDNFYVMPLDDEAVKLIEN